MRTPVLETERILLRPPKVSDAETMYNNWLTDPDVARFMRWNVHKSVAATIKWLTDVELNVLNKNAYDWAFILKENNEIFGTGGIYYNEDYKMLEIGYNLMKKYWGLGLAAEASEAMLKFAVDELNERNFYARYVKENIASGRVLEKLGFVYKQDGKYSAFDGRMFESREYFLSV